MTQKLRSLLLILIVAGVATQPLNTHTNTSLPSLTIATATACYHSAELYAQKAVFYQNLANVLCKATTEYLKLREDEHFCKPTDAQSAAHRLLSYLDSQLTPFAKTVHGDYAKTIELARAECAKELQYVVSLYNDNEMRCLDSRYERATTDQQKTTILEQQLVRAIEKTVYVCSSEKRQARIHEKRYYVVEKSIIESINLSLSTPSADPSVWHAFIPAYATYIRCVRVADVYQAIADGLFAAKADFLLSVNRYDSDTHDGYTVENILRRNVSESLGDFDHDGSIRGSIITKIQRRSHASGPEDCYTGYVQELDTLASTYEQCARTLLRNRLRDMMQITTA